MEVVHKFHVTEEEESIYFMSKYSIHQAPTPLRLKQTSHFFHLSKKGNIIHNYLSLLHKCLYYLKLPDNFLLISIKQPAGS
jgi:hypothetical protein